MEYKICENCEAKLHFRTQKCPICNTILTEASKIVNDEAITEKNETLGNNYDITISDEIKENTTEIKTETLTQDQPTENITSKPEEPNQNMKDYIYKAEVHHSLEYTEPLSNLIKVLLTTLTALFPMMGQLIGLFFGIFFSTYDDRDRKSFGKALIILSIIMFMIYAYTLMAFSEIMTTNSFNNFIK